MRFGGVGGAAVLVVVGAVVACSGSESAQRGQGAPDGSAQGGEAGATQSGSGGVPGRVPDAGRSAGGAPGGQGSTGGRPSAGGGAGAPVDVDAGVGGRVPDAAAGPVDAAETDVAIGSAGGAPGSGGGLGSGGAASGGANGTGGVGSGGITGSGGATGTGTCRSNFDCAPGVCDVVDNRCFGCNVDADCPAQQECRNRSCVAVPTCATSLNCANRTDGRTVCSGGRCVECGTTNDCPAQSSCLANQCRPQCNSDNDCTPRGMLCNFGSGVCVGCVTSAACAADEFCKSSVCVPDTCPASRDVCAGSTVVACNAEGSATTAVKDCGAGQCVESANSASCTYPHCGNHTLDANETDVDCGGGDCPACVDGDSCVSNGDCKSLSCKRTQTFQDAGSLVEGGIPVYSGTCTEPSCTDGFTNGHETGIDCGGGTRGSGCGKCSTFSTCVDGTDCISGNCVPFGLNFYVCY